MVTTQTPTEGDFCTYDQCWLDQLAEKNPAIEALRQTNPNYMHEELIVVV